MKERIIKGGFRKNNKKNKNKIIIVVVVVILSGLFLTNAIGANNFKDTTSDLNEDKNDSQQSYIVISPNIIENDGTIGIYGRNFCLSTKCSAVNIIISNEYYEFEKIIANVSVQNNGTFAINIRVNVPSPDLYIITAKQMTEDGRILNVSVPIGISAKEEVALPRERPQNISGISGVGAATYGVVNEFAPNIRWGGRGVAVDVSRSNNAVAIVASESGGLWKTKDTGSTWSHIDGLRPFRMHDVKFAPGNDQIIIATTLADLRKKNGGGIWRSTDGGVNWYKPLTADPTPGPKCPGLFSGFGISFAPGTNDVFVGTDCGVAVSHDLGATWTHVVPDPINSVNFKVVGVNAQRGSQGTIVDVIGEDGHHRSINGGATWTPTRTQANGGLPTARGVQSIAASPIEPNVLFAAINGKSLYESDNGGASWTKLNPNQKDMRESWVATHLSSDGDPNHFDIYFSGGVNTVRQTCTNNGGPGLRCSTNWNTIWVEHADQNDLAFSTSSNCAQYIVSDGGIHKTSDCGANWPIIGSGIGGYHALQVHEMNGQVHPDHTDLYFGTMDNDLWASGDNGITWPYSMGAEGFYIQTTHKSPTDSGQTITAVTCWPCSNQKTSAHFTNPTLWNNSPSESSSPFIIEQDVFIQWGMPNPPTSQLYITTDAGDHWTAIPGAITNLQRMDRPFVSGNPSTPVIYQEVLRSQNPDKTGLIKITGIRSGTAKVTNADSGLINIGFWKMGSLTWRFAQVFGVDPNDPQHLIAADIGKNKMMVSRNGGTTWTEDTLLTNLVTNYGEFQFSKPFVGHPGLPTEASAIAFDPSNGNRILVGTEHAGIIATLDGGTTWSKLPGSEMVNAVSSFFFDEVRKEVMTSTYGRGLWKLDFSKSIIYQYSGKIQFLRINEAGGYGPPDDRIDTEVVMGLFGSTKRFGFQFRNDTYLPVHIGMLKVARDAFNNNRTVVVEALFKPARNNGILYRIWEPK